MGWHTEIIAINYYYRIYRTTNYHEQLNTQVTSLTMRVKESIHLNCNAIIKIVIQETIHTQICTLIAHTSALEMITDNLFWLYYYRWSKHPIIVSFLRQMYGLSVLQVQCQFPFSLNEGRTTSVNSEQLYNTVCMLKFDETITKY